MQQLGEYDELELSFAAFNSGGETYRCCAYSIAYFDAERRRRCTTCRTMEVSSVSAALHHVKCTT